jgi:hypothetical protein
MNERTSPGMYYTCLNSFIIQNMDAVTLGVKVIFHVFS